MVYSTCRNAEYICTRLTAWIWPVTGLQRMFIIRLPLGYSPGRIYVRKRFGPIIVWAYNQGFTFQPERPEEENKTFHIVLIVLPNIHTGTNETTESVVFFFLTCIQQQQQH